MKRLIYVFAIIAMFFTSCGRSGDIYLDAAIDTSNWLEYVKSSNPDGTFWPPKPDTGKSGGISLYHGSPGVLLFYNDLYKVSNSQQYKDILVNGANWLMSMGQDDENSGLFWSDEISSIEKADPDPGLYTGTAGVGYTFLELYKTLSDKKYLDLAKKAAENLLGTVVKNETGISWTGSNDIISGAAGTSMFLLRLYDTVKDERYLAAASAAGDYLIAKALKDENGWQWAAFTNFTLIYPNFSHGTSGVAFYLGLLYEYTGESKYLDAALKGAEWLENNLDEEQPGSAWVHDNGKGSDLYYVSYCHGPPGTARLFYQLYLVTNDKKWMNLLVSTAEWLMNVGLHETRLDGYWNAGQCCGTAGIGDFYLNMYKVTKDKNYLLNAKKVTEYLLAESSIDSGRKWVLAENRTSPDVKYAQTGWAQGASGIGLFLVKLHVVENAISNFRPAAFPDNPFK